MNGRRFLGLMLVAGLGGCGDAAASRTTTAVTPEPSAPELLAPELLAPEPLASEPVAMASAAPVKDPVLAYAQAEAALHAHVTALALDAATGVIAAHAHRAEDEGPELVWYPTLRHVAARQRHVTYATPEAGTVQRGSDPAQPFLVEIIVLCHVRTMSGEGVTYVGEAPSQDAPTSNRMLPQATIVSDSALLVEDLRPAAIAALASCAAAEPVSEMVRITLLFAFQRDQDAVVLLRHVRNDARAP